MANKLFTFHGSGGGAGECNFGSGGDHPSASWYQTIELSGGDWTQSTTTIIDTMLLPQIAVGDNVILHAFSLGCVPLANILANGTTLNGTLRGVIFDDPAFNGVAMTNANAGVRRALWATQSSSGQWVVETLSGGGGAGAIQNLASRLNVTPQVNPYFQQHAPMAFNCNLNTGPQAGPPELAQTSVWWTAGEPPPPTGDQTTYQAESATIFNGVADGARVSTDSPGYTGFGYIGYWWQSPEGVRWTNVLGGTVAGNRDLRFRYRCAEASGSVTRRLRVNGTDRGLLTFTRNANAWSDNSWTDHLIQGIPLNVGNNTVELQIESPGGIDLDYLMVNVVGGTAPPPSTGGATPPRVIAGEGLFPADYFCYADISALPVLADSASRINGHLSDPTYRPEWGTANYTDQVTADFGSGTMFNPKNGETGPFGFPLKIVEAGQAHTTVLSFNNGFGNAESDINIGETWPVPLDTPVEHNSDVHVTVLQKGTHRLYEGWDCDREATGWIVGQTSLWDLTSYAARPLNWTSADASGLPIIPLSVSDDEVLDVGVINHALRICITYSDASYVWPANHAADPGNVRTPRLTMGHWLRLKSSVSPSARGLGPQATIIANCLKKHGAIVIDIGPFLKINGFSGPRWNNADLNTLRGLHAADFEVVNPASLRVSTSDRNIWYKINQNTPTTPPPVGSPIAITGRPNTFALEVESSALVTAAADALVSELQTGWDGVLLTDAYAETGQGLQQNTAYDTNAEVQSITQTAITSMMNAVRAAGFLAVASVDDIADTAALSNSWEVLGTGVEDPEFLRDDAGVYKGTTVAAQQATNVPHSQVDGNDLFSHFNMHRTVWASKDAAIHALATYLCFNDGAAVLAVNQDSGLNDPPPYTEEFTFDYGTELVARAQPFTNVYYRRFTNGAAITNLSGTAQTVTLGATYYNFTSTTGFTNITVPAQSGVVLRTTPISSPPPPNPSGTTGTIQAEAGTLSSSAGHAISTSSPGYNGTGYIGNWWQINERVTLTINIPTGQGGNYDLTFRYRCAEPDGSADRTVSINGGAGITVNFPANTTGWTNNAWATVTRTQVALVAGNNTIALTCPSSSGNGLDFDEMSWKPTSSTSPPPPSGGTGFFVFSGNELRDPENRRLAILGANGSYRHFTNGTESFIQNMPVTNPPLPGNIRSTFSGRSADVQAWGWNFIRMTTVPSAAGGLSTQLPKMLAVIDEYTAKKIMVTFCHLSTQDSTSNPPFSNSLVQESMEMWRQILAARPDNPYIWIDCGGEIVESSDTGYWSSFYTSCYNAIRAMPGGANNMIMCTAPGHGQDAAAITGSIWNSFASGKHHICLDWHMYCASGGASVQQSTLNALRTANIPLVIMEHGSPATPAGGPPAGFNPGACCGATYANQRASCLQLIDTWVPTTRVNAVWWIATGDDSSSCSHSLRYSPPNNGTFQDWNMPFSEYGQKMWNVGQQSRFY